MTRNPKEQTLLYANLAVPLLVKRLKNGEGLPLPRYHSAEAAGFDLCAAFHDQNAVAVLRAGEQINIGCGFAFHIPPGFSLEIRPRSGLAFKYGVTIQNSPGTIDADFRGEIVIMLARPLAPMPPMANGAQPIETRLNRVDLSIKHGERIAQAVVMPIFKAYIKETEELDETERGTRGLGSTGV